VSSIGLSHVYDADEESVEALSDTDQAVEAVAVEGVEDAAHHPERPTHTDGRSEDTPPRKREDGACVSASHRLPPSGESRRLLGQSLYW